MSGYFLRTKRVGFRCWAAEDLPIAVAIWGDPEVTRLIADLGNPSEHQARDRLAREMANQDIFGLQYWPIFLLNGGASLGCCGLRPYNPNDGVFEIGAHILPKYWRQGYGTEAVRGVIAYAFGSMNVQGLFARHNPHNKGSRRILEKLGFQHTHNELMPQTGLDHLCYCLRPTRLDEWSPGVDFP
jgi:RimJ/RimL family protein N-acetyltransferase